MEKIKPENSKQKILETAVKFFAHKGFNGVSIREICKEADVNLCMISYYFGGKKELYNAILDDLIERQTEFAKTFIEFSKNPYNMTRDEATDILNVCLENFVDFFYSKVSSDLILLLLKTQQNENVIVNTPTFNYIKKLVGSIMNKPENDREVIFKTLFMVSQINSPRILPAFSLRLLGQNDFMQEDIKIIKDNVKKYVNLIIKGAKID